MIKKLSALTLAASVLASPAFAKISFSLDIEALTAANGTTQLSNSGLLVLVVDTGTNGSSYQFDGPSAGNLVSGDDEIVATWDLGKVGPGTSDITLLTEGGVEWGSNWDKDDHLALYWFPNLSDSNKSPAADEPYGVFTDSASLASGDSWVMPADGTFLQSLKLFTSAATKLVAFGDVPAAVGKASYAIGSTPPASSAPTGVVLANDGSTIKVSWADGDAGNGGFVVQRKNQSSSTWETVGFAAGGETTFTDSNVEPGAAYDYQLLALTGLQALSSPSAMIEALRSRIIAFDSRAKMRTGVNKRTIDLTVTGDEELPVLLQAIGPSLHDSGFVPLARPIPTDAKLDLYYGIKPDSVADRLIATNDDWDLAPDKQTLIDVMKDYGAYPMYNHEGSGDSAFLAMVNEIVGGYTSPVVDPLGSEGIAVVGIYDVDYLSPTPSTTRLTGVASRGFVGIGYENMRSSVNIVGDVQMKLLIRAQGPWLRDLSDSDQFNSDVVLDDPTLVFNKLVNGAWVEVARNDDWGTGNTATTTEMNTAADSVGLARLSDGSKDSALLLTVDPGIYQAIVEGAAGETGVAQIAIFEVVP